MGRAPEAPLNAHVLDDLNNKPHQPQTAQSGESGDTFHHVHPDRATPPRPDDLSNRMDDESRNRAEEPHPSSEKFPIPKPIPEEAKESSGAEPRPDKLDDQTGESM